VDPLDAYDHLLRLVDLRTQAHYGKRGDYRRRLLFAYSCGRPLSSRDVARIAQRIAKAAGWRSDEIEHVGAKAFRVGGAIDLRLVYGVEVASQLLKRRGRWGTDIGEIYARTSLEEQVDVSARIGDARRGTDLERMCAGWAQPR
jgi:hypothetical protein